MKKQFTEEQIIGFLHAGQRTLPAARLVGSQSYFLWRNKLGGMNVSDAKRLKDLKVENARLKKLFLRTGHTQSECLP